MHPLYIPIDQKLMNSNVISTGIYKQYTAGLDFINY